MTDLTTLIAKLEAATGPDRELDVAISCAVDGRVLERRGNDRKPWLYPVEGDGGRQDPSAYGQFLSPRFTASIDAAVALAERVLPGWGGLLGIGSGTSIATADLWSEARGNQSEEDDELNPIVGEDTHAEHASLPIALTIAILKAKQAEEKP